MRCATLPASRLQGAKNTAVEKSRCLKYKDGLQEESQGTQESQGSQEP